MIMIEQLFDFCEFLQVFVTFYFILRVCANGSRKSDKTNR